MNSEEIINSLNRHTVSEIIKTGYFLNPQKKKLSWKLSNYSVKVLSSRNNSAYYWTTRNKNALSTYWHYD